MADLGLLDQVPVGTGGGQHFAIFRSQTPDNSRANHTAMARHKDALSGEGKLLRHAQLDTFLKDLANPKCIPDAMARSDSLVPEVTWGANSAILVIRTGCMLLMPARTCDRLRAASTILPGNTDKKHSFSRTFANIFESHCGAFVSAHSFKHLFTGACLANQNR